MKNIVIIFVLAFFCTSAMAQSALSKKDLKGIKVKDDAFSETTFYTSKHTGLYVAVSVDDCTLNWTLSCMDIHPIIVEGISIKVDGKVYNIPFSYEQRKEYHRIPVSTPYYYSEVTIRAERHSELIEKIIKSDSPTLIRYSVYSLSKTSIIDGEINAKYRKGTEQIIGIYKKISNAQ